MPRWSLRFRNVLATLFCASLVAHSASAADYRVYYLGGQSNMDGYGYVDQLSPEQAAEVAGVMIYHGNMAPDAQPVDGRGRWDTLKAGHGVGFSSDGTENKLSNRFGVELTFARKLQALHPDEKIALIKYSRGGTSIAIEAARNFGCWDPDFNTGDGDGAGINQYDHFLATIKGATAVQDIDGDGEADRLIPTGIVWMQGESDAAWDEEVAKRYEANLKRLMDLIRAALREDDLPVAIGRISDSGNDGDGKVWDWGDIVRQAEADFVTKDGSAALVTSTDNYGYSDPWHYDSPGYLDLGEKFAEALSGLRKK